MVKNKQATSNRKDWIWQGGLRIGYIDKTTKKHVNWNYSQVLSYRISVKYLRDVHGFSTMAMGLCKYWIGIATSMHKIYPYIYAYMHACVHAYLHTYIHTSLLTYFLACLLTYLTLTYLTLLYFTYLSLPDLTCLLTCLLAYLLTYIITLHYITLHYITSHCVTLLH